MSAGNVEKAVSILAEPEREGVTARMMYLLETLDTIQGQVDSILGVALGLDSTLREAAPVAILDLQVDFARDQAQQISDKLSRVYRAL